MNRGFRIVATVDYENPGKQIGQLIVPNSTNHSGWGSLLMPICVVGNGEGPTVLFTGGNHGDEYEGPLALLKLARELTAERVNGRVIILPGLNFPALLTGTRLSPIDGRNMNRVFPGRFDGSVTEMIADYVYRALLPMADAVVDLHSGGSSMIFTPCAVVHRLDDAQQMRATLDAGKAFGAPILLLLRELDSAGMLDGAVEDLGKVFVSTELGGGGFVTPHSLAVAERGVRNILRHFGVLDEPSEGETSRLMETPPVGAYEMARSDGLYEPLLEVGEAVRSGSPLGRIHDPHVPEQPAREIRSTLDGVLITRAGRGWVRRGDTIAVLATDIEDA